MNTWTWSRSALGTEQCPSTANRKSSVAIRLCRPLHDSDRDSQHSCVYFNLVEDTRVVLVCQKRGNSADKASSSQLVEKVAVIGQLWRHFRRLQRRVRRQSSAASPGFVRAQHAVALLDLPVGRVQLDDSGRCLRPWSAGKCLSSADARTRIRSVDHAVAVRRYAGRDECRTRYTGHCSTWIHRNGKEIQR